MVTGASAVSLDGVRFGKGHGFFDLEWGMFTDMGIVDDDTPVAAVVHDCQVVEDKLHPSETDILVDFIATPTRTASRSSKRGKRPRGVKWDLLDPEQIAADAAAPGAAEAARARLIFETSANHEKGNDMKIGIDRRHFLGAHAAQPLPRR